MKIMLTVKLKLVITFLLCFGLTGLQAQEAITSTGGNASGSGGTVSYTAGQIIYSTIAGANGSVAQGVQQPYEISVVSGIEDTENINLILSAYPNPTSDFLTLKIDASFTYSIQSASYQLYDIGGKFIETKKIEDFETTISMKHLIPTIYFLKIIHGRKVVKTFKIIKN